MEATSLFSSSCFTASSPPSALCPPQNLDHRGLFSLTVNRRRCQISVVGKKLSFCQMAVLRGNVRATGVPTSVPVRVAHELHQAGHRYLDVRTPEEFIAGHAPGAINIPYMYKVGSGMTRNPNFLAEVSSHFGKYDEIIVGCQLGKRSLMAATDLLAAGFTAVTDIAGGYAAWTQNRLPIE
ncbi:thiosulfate sulfurtransferase 16, chloroplastic-like isoform X1 [Durio zibethinus]|uniref:Thiosulfate sulfurtransferase 16, chloroplastic-like isoform X1 n=1 Tax=Durio zibethinus TaxID=66656 RepID=A0A6P6BEE3_DURZI|nr:thiosulfate sulfurtransferase 16, chloroplastic-like isoform X1 [Durio zibethinus]XP_022775470.1 thiosulfate sulfurtransferase 16, chloroplastic-like isoform X1 [Durio zibethinus]XP_022775471.1 thiosulfate sulfurtransferase 16, chloroplastic-like isoform X1 [Durio zibethinus]